MLLKVALLIDPHVGYYQTVLRGIADYARPDRPWRFRLLSPREPDLTALTEWSPRGLIAALMEREFGEAVCALGVPVVNVAALPELPELPQVGNDDDAIGALAAQHLLERGFREFGYVAWPRDAYFRGREEGFRREVGAAGYAVSRYGGPGDGSASWERDEAALREWLRGLPRPVGVFAANDAPGWQAVEACREAGLRVPEDVAIVGADNSDPLCRLCAPPLSSIAVAGERIGFEAARLLDDLMAGRTPESLRVGIPPVGVVTRQSSDVLAVDDADMAAALRFIRERAYGPLDVSDVARAAGVNRRTLERRFASLLRRTPLEEIRRARVERARSLLADTDAPVSLVAERSGFDGPKRLASVFRQETGETPTAYRRRFRPKG